MVAACCWCVAAVFRSALRETQLRSEQRPSQEAETFEKAEEEG